MCYIIFISLVPDAERFSIFESSLLHIPTYLIHKSVSAGDILPHLTRDFLEVLMKQSIQESTK